MFKQMGKIFSGLFSVLFQVYQTEYPMMSIKLLFSSLATIATVVIFILYCIRSILLGHTKPPVFSWVVWA